MCWWNQGILKICVINPVSTPSFLSALHEVGENDYAFTKEMNDVEE